jgi:hypothetical protein
MTTSSLARLSTRLPLVSLKEQSTSELMTAIHLPHDPGLTLRRVEASLAHGWDARYDPETKMAVREDFLVALAPFPQWAVQRAFDTWVRENKFSPTPGHIVELVRNELRPLHEELAKRQRQERLAVEEGPEPEPISKERAAQLMMEAGFTPQRMHAVQLAPMATTFQDAIEHVDAPPVRHWSETAPPDDPRMVTLRAARQANALITPPVDEAVNEDQP